MRIKGDTIVVKITNDITKLYWGEFDPYEVKIIRTQDGYKFRLMGRDGEWNGSKEEN